MTIQNPETEPDGQLLDRALPAIALPEASLADEREATRLAIRSADLLDTLTNLGRAIAEENEQLDALELITPGSWAAEEFHSRIISWLLNPSAHHRQAGHFITSLLSATTAPPRLLAADWSTTQVLQEWENVVDGQRGYLDILILNQDYRTLIAIENKTFSQEHSNQLTRYRRALADTYPDFARHLIFLSPTGLPPNLERDREYWHPARYSVIHDAIQQVLEMGIADPNANALLQIYATSLRRTVMPDTSIDQQARRIYLEHREAVDRIVANKPNWLNETKPMLKEAVAKHSFWKLDREDAQYVGFRAADWAEFPSSRPAPAGGTNPTRFCSSNSSSTRTTSRPTSLWRFRPPTPATPRSGPLSSMPPGKIPPSSNPGATLSPTTGLSCTWNRTTFSNQPTMDPAGAMAPPGARSRPGSTTSPSTSFLK